MGIEISEIAGGGLPKRGSKVMLLPTNFAQLPQSREYHSNTISFVKFARGQLDLDYAFEPETLLEQRSEDWFAPALLLSNQLIADHPLIVSVICGVISNYLFAVFKNRPKPQVSLDLICERTASSTYVRISYKGDVEGLTQLQEVVRKSIGTDEE